MIGHTIIHASDPHLGAAGGIERAIAAEAAWAAFDQAVARAQPDLVILSGDLVVDDPDNDDDQCTSHRLICALPAPVIVIPGNHDVGDHRIRVGLPADWHGKVVTDERVRRWECRWGPSFGLTTLGSWKILTINSQLLGSGLERETQQWCWLEHEALPSIGTTPFLLFTHESLDVRPDTNHTDNWMSIPSSASARLAALLQHRSIAAVCSGHTHRYLSWSRNGIRSITAPSLTGPIPVRADMTQAAGDPASGWLTYTLGAIGNLQVDHHTVTVR